MSIVPNPIDEAFASGMRLGCENGTRLRWYKYPGNCPPDRPGGDSRCLCWIETGDGMAYIGLRMYRICADGDGHAWFSNSQEESGRVTHWMPLPDPPWIMGEYDLKRDDFPFTRATEAVKGAQHE
jgi:Protein of unknown function (DUF551)